MKVNKEKILETARILFNQRGLNAVTARVISTELNISPGSFSYHFPDKSRIIIELYRTMNREIKDCLQTTLTLPIKVGSILTSFETFAVVQLRYKFFFLNLFEILNDFPSVKQHHKRSLAEERILTQQLFKLYVKEGVFEVIPPEKELRTILRQCQILFTYWIADAELGEFKSETDKITYYQQVCCAFILPFLSKKSAIEYRNYIKLQGK
ncbi:DNA-binding transcriptional regulator, AcrR family [Chitinophaga eiseniae]|uniref:DNA-binding transcriptional regulator, AcrR family n=1 Tax=Chitinophaga eiseniae TaxID=634771 RepID=A0A1T4SM88_9BACT|nr:TetR/AcrR family transcriptional regulator [Chitinophaga eiseniae]SKA29400.1 DNA-binding transcriptional regulator, AcrR family [Chitinophaga eiseniae]